MQEVEDQAAMESQKIKVAIRIRPLLEHEINSG